MTIHPVGDSRSCMTFWDEKQARNYALDRARRTGIVHVGVDCVNRIICRALPDGTLSLTAYGQEMADRQARWERMAPVQAR